MYNKYLIYPPIQFSNVNRYFAPLISQLKSICEMQIKLS